MDSQASRSLKIGGLPAIPQSPTGPDNITSRSFGQVLGSKARVTSARRPL
jgi:hypothetical protein